MCRRRRLWGGVSGVRAGMGGMVGHALADVVRISLLARRQSLEMLLNLEWDNRRRRVREVIRQLGGVHCVCGVLACVVLLLDEMKLRSRP